MIICVPKEAYPLEKRVIMLPSAVRKLVERGHAVFVQNDAGAGIDIPDSDYAQAGAQLLVDPRELYALAGSPGKKMGLVVKLKAPLPDEFSLMKNCILFSMFHSEQNPRHVYYAGLQGLMVVEMERVRNARNERLVTQTRLTGEAGILYSLTHSKKMPYDMQAVILGYGNVSSGAIGMCSRLGITYKIIRKSEFRFMGEYIKEADLLVNGIAWPMKARQKRRYIVTREQIRNSPLNLIVLDLSVDFPNPIETIRPTTYTQPYYIEEGRVHISIYGYPGLFPETSSKIYSEQVLPLVMTIADNEGLEKIGRRGELGKIIRRAVFDAGKLDWENYRPPDIRRGSKIE